MSHARWALLLGTLVGSQGAFSVAEDAATISPEQFDNSVLFGRTAPGEARAYLIALLENELRSVQEFSPPAPAMARIRAAGEEDIDVWLSCVDAARKEYTNQRLTEERLAQVRRFITDLRSVWTSGFLFGPESHFAKAVGAELKPEQIATFKARFVPEQVQVRVVLPAVRVVNVGLSIVMTPDGERLYSVPAAYFDQRVLGGNIKPTTLRTQLETELKLQVGDLAANLELTSDQQDKLQLAGRGDMKAWFDRVDDLRTTVTAEPLEQQRYIELSRVMLTLAQDRQNGLWNESSLFQKTLLRMLNTEQRELFQVAERERWIVAIDAALAATARNVAPKLAVDKRRNVAELIFDRCGPRSSRTSINYVVLLQADEIVADLKPLLTDAEWNAFETQINNAKRFEATLRANGLWPVRRPEDEEPAPSTSCVPREGF